MTPPLPLEGRNPWGRECHSPKPPPAHRPLPAPKPAPVPPAPRWPASSVGRSGLYFYNVDSTLAGWDSIIQACQQNHWWVALLTHETTVLRTQFSPPELRERLQAAGITVIATGWVDAGAPLDAQADTIHQAVQGYDEYMPNVEDSWAYPNPGFSKSAEFAPLVRQALGDMPMGRVSVQWGQQTHLRPWLEAGVQVFMPQCYQNQYQHMNPTEAIRRLGWAQHDGPGLPPTAVEPTYGKWGSYNVPLDFYQDAHKAAGSPPCSVWAGEFLDAAEVQELGGW